MVDQSLPFAMALLDIGISEKKDTQFLEQLDLLAQTLADNPDLEKYLEHPGISAKAKQEMLDQVFADTNLDQSMKDFLRILLRHRMAGKLVQIDEDYRKLYDSTHNIENVTVTSAAALDEKQIEALRAMLEKKLNRSVHMEVHVDPALIAGLRIRTEHMTLDNSYQSRLENMKEQLLKN